MILATAIGVFGLYAVSLDRTAPLSHVWLVTLLWVSMRAFWGVSRLFTGIVGGPLRASADST